MVRPTRPSPLPRKRPTRILVPRKTRPVARRPGQRGRWVPGTLGGAVGTWLPLPPPRTRGPGARRPQGRLTAHRAARSRVRPRSRPGPRELPGCREHLLKGSSCPIAGQRGDSSVPQSEDDSGGPSWPRTCSGVRHSRSPTPVPPAPHGAPESSLPATAWVRLCTPERPTGPGGASCPVCADGARRGVLPRVCGTGPGGASCPLCAGRALLHQAHLVRRAE